LEKTSRKCQQQIVKKGHMVAVEGRSDPWVCRKATNARRYITEVVCDRLSSLESKKFCDSYKPIDNESSIEQPETKPIKLL
jgi:single-stranded DNA-binding protein